MKMKPMFMLFCLMSLLPLAYAQDMITDQFVMNPFYNGDVYFSLAGDTYSAGETLSTNFTVVNMESFPLVGAYLVVDVVKGGAEPVNPSQSSDADNVFYEEVIRDLNILPLNSSVVPFSYRLPADLSSGDYRLDVYLKTDRTSVVGIPHLFQSPNSQNFRVVGGGIFPYAVISRTETVFENETGPVGVGVDAGSIVNGTVSIIKDPGQPSLTNSVLSVYVCDWDDTSCVEPNDFYLIKNYSVPPLGGNDSVQVGVDFNAPEKPNAYAIRLELKDADGRTISLYRSRIVVEGETAHIHKMAIDKYYYKENDPGTVMVLVGPSPDHYTNPVTTNASVSVYINSNGKTIYSDSSIIPELSGDSYPVAVSQTFNFTAPEELKVFEVCSQVDSSAGLLYDRYCYTVNASKFPSVESCGNGRCGLGEDESNCCTDCGCTSGKTCINNACITNRQETTLANQQPPTAGKDERIYYIALGVIIILVGLALMKLRKPKTNVGGAK